MYNYTNENQSYNHVLYRLSELVFYFFVIKFYFFLKKIFFIA